MELAYFVNFGLATPEVTGLICVPIYLYWAKIDLHTFIRRAAIQKCFGILERWWAHAITAAMSWYKFGGLLSSNSGVYRTQLCSLQQASNSTWVSSSTFVRGRHCYAAERSIRISSFCRSRWHWATRHVSHRPAVQCSDTRQLLYVLQRLS